ncbi:hypothetical protein Misp04_62440 [Micromonospora sp. NBRC 101691]|nr:hypothetical protein Misp04_62440 [Micromonospora sp. NBRC 101691]
MITGKQPRIVLVDDLRSFVDGRAAQVARTSAAGVEVLERHRGRRLDELWLDHDLGGDDTIWPVVEAPGGACRRIRVPARDGRAGQWPRTR